jgi:HEAT repeat protein
MTLFGGVAAGSFAPGDPVLAVAFWIGAGVLLLTLLLGLQIVRLRMALRRRERREARVLNRWRPILAAAIAGEPPGELPPLPRADRIYFIKLWVHLQASLRGEAGASLVAIARRLGLDGEARAMLAGRRRTERLLAALLLGHLRDATAWPTLQRLAALPDVTVSLTALWALVRIDPQAATAHLTPMFVARDDWAMSHVAGVLRQAPAPVAAVLVELLPALPRERLPRALRIADALQVEVPDALLARALDDGGGDDGGGAVAVITAALRLVRLPGSRERVRALLAHDDWQVRVQAAKALGRIGDRSDVARLVTLLGDREWWVRYRAAEALAELPWLTRADLAQLRDGLSDRYAADMLAQVLAEEGSA